MPLAPRPSLMLLVLASACYAGSDLEATGTAPTFPPPGNGDTADTTDADPVLTTMETPGTTTGWPEPEPTTGWGTEPTSSTTSGTDPDPTGLTTTAPDDPSTTGEPEPPCPRVRVTVAPGEVLNVRPTPSTAQAPIGTLSSGVIRDVLAIVQGELINGVDTWYQIDGPWQTGYIFGGFAECTLDEPPSDDGYYLPLQCGKSALVSQGNNSNFSHNGNSAYAFDFALPLGTPLVAINSGTVTALYDKTQPGHPCYNGGGQECSGHANYVTLLHADGTGSVYAHLSAVSVSLGQVVPRGSVVGLTGSTGWSTGRHAHVARQQNCGGGFCQSIPVQFVDVPGDGVPETGDTVTSQNCP